MSTLGRSHRVKAANSDCSLRLPDGITVEPVHVEVQVTPHYVEVGPGYERTAATVTDAAGHAHVFGREGTPDTVAPVERPCDGACGDPEHEETVLVCRECTAEVQTPTRYRAENRRVPLGTADFALTVRVSDYAPGATRLMALAASGGPVDVTVIGPDGVARSGRISAESLTSMGESIYRGSMEVPPPVEIDLTIGAPDA